MIGDVTIESGASVWYGAVLRGDDGPIIVRERANIQDNSVIHTTLERVTEIGRGATVAHQCMVHGAVVEEEALVGNGCVVLDGARIGARSMIAAMSLVPPGQQIPPGVLRPASRQGQRRDGRHPGRVLGQDEPGLLPGLAKRHAVGITRIER